MCSSDLGRTAQQQLEAAGDLFSRPDTTGTVHLTLRNDLQELARTALKGREGSAVVLDPRLDTWAAVLIDDESAALLVDRLAAVEDPLLVGAVWNNVRTSVGLARLAPSFGMVGTITGMIQLFQNMGEDRMNLGSAISLALLATLYGVAFGAGVAGPIGHFLRNLLDERLGAIERCEQTVGELIARAGRDGARRGTAASRAGQPPRAGGQGRVGGPKRTRPRARTTILKIGRAHV